MKKILIISFRKLGDVISLALPIYNFKTNNPFSQIFLCTYEENISAANLLGQVDKIVTISRSRLCLLSQNKIFNKSFLINEFTNQLSEIMNEEWDIVFNASNDEVGTFLASGLNAKEVVGVRLDSERLVIHNPISSFVKNEINTTFSATPVHQIDLDNYSLNKNMVVQSYAKSIKVDPVLDLNANEEMKKIKSRVGRPLVGINFQAGHVSKEINIGTVEALISEMLDNTGYYPIILLDPKNDQSQTHLKYLNEKFNNSLVAIEVDFKGMPSILNRLDYLITTDSAIKHLADALGVKMVEVSQGTSPFLRQGSISAGNIIVSPITSNRPNVSPGSERSLVSNTPSQSQLSGKDLYFALLLRSGIAPDTIQSALSSNVTCYIVRNNRPGVCYFPYWGDINVDHELNRIAASIFTFECYLNSKNMNIWSDFSLFFNPEEIHAFINREKGHIAVALKAILNCLRTLRSKNVATKDQKTFLANLNTLIDWNEPDRLCSIPIRAFESSLISVSPSKATERLNEVEKLLFNLKSQIQTLTTVLDLMNIKKSSSQPSASR